MEQLERIRALEFYRALGLDQHPDFFQSLSAFTQTQAKLVRLARNLELQRKLNINATAYTLMSSVNAVLTCGRLRLKI
jgi:hypothetical protein